eukprot:143456-Prymnesium_polylepis.3
MEREDATRRRQLILSILRHSRLVRPRDRCDNDGEGDRAAHDQEDGIAHKAIAHVAPPGLVAGGGPVVDALVAAVAEKAEGASQTVAAQRRSSGAPR